MKNVNQAFQEMTSQLELTDNEQSEASRQQNVLRANLRNHSELEVEHDFLSGSYSRKTAIRPLKDIDCILVLSRSRHARLLEQRPHVALQLLQRVLGDAYPNKERPRVQNRSVNIQFTGTGIGFDVVPAFVDGDAWLIPDQKADRWIRSNPQLHASFSTIANDATDKKAKPLIKVAKHWLRTVGKPVKSFHLEVMSYNILRGYKGNYVQGLEHLFRGLAQCVSDRCPEPAGLGDDLDLGLDSAARRLAESRFLEAAEAVGEANRLAADGDTEGAHYLFRRLLGDVYPERGRAPKSGVPAVVASTGSTRSSVDSSTKRFG